MIVLGVVCSVLPSAVQAMSDTMAERVISLLSFQVCVIVLPSVTLLILLSVSEVHLMLL